MMAVARAHPHARPHRFRVSTTLAYAALTVWALFTILPILWTYVVSLKEPADVFALPPSLIFKPTLHNYLELFNLDVTTEFENAASVTTSSASSSFPQYFVNSLVVSIATTGLALVLGSLAAYALTRFRYRFGSGILIGMFMTRLVPPIAIVVPLYLIWREVGLIDTQFALIVTYLSFTLPFVVWLMRGFLKDIPIDLEEAAMTDGCSRIGALWRIVLPLIAPGLATTAIFALIGAWNEFLFAVVLTSGDSKTLPAAILEFKSDKAILWGRLYAAGDLIMLPVLIFGLMMQKRLVRGLTGGAVTG
jgi:ABC-type glycerol-3-phosphate transport system permease component